MGKRDFLIRKQKIIVYPSSTVSSAEGNYSEGVRGDQGPTGPTGNGTNYATDAERIALFTTDLGGRLTTLENKGSWITLAPQSPWANYGGLWSPLKYRLVDGVVYLTGLIGTPTVQPLGSVIAILPVGYRPAKHDLYITHDEAGGVHTEGRVDIIEDGTISHVYGGWSYVSLSGICFSVT